MIRTLPVLLAVLPLLASCEQERVAPPPPPEICDDGIDNDEDGLVDCDDTESCGGINCQEPGGNEDTAPEPPPIVEVIYDDADCCDFSFSVPDACDVITGTFRIINRSDDDGLIKNISCETPGKGTGAILEFAVGNSQPMEFVANARLPGLSDNTVNVWYDCFTDQSFQVDCRAKAEVNDVESEVTWTVTGTAIKP